MVGSKVMVLMFFQPVVHVFKYVCRDEGEEAVCSAVEHGWKQGHGSHVLSACGSCIQI